MKFLQQFLDHLKGIFNLRKRFKKESTMPDGSWDFELEKKDADVRDAWYEEVFGSVNFGGRASKDYRKFAPKLEIQAHGDCVSFSRNSAAETKAIAKDSKDPDGDIWNFSDIDLAVGSGTSRTGNSLKRVAEYARKTGVSLEKDVPYTRNWNERIRRFNDGKNKTKYKLGNWSKVKPNINSLKSALDYSVVQIGIGVGWTWNQGGIIKKPNQYNFYHAIDLLYIDEEGKKYIYDSYNPAHKTLDKDYPILFAMSFRDLPANWRGINTEGERLHKRLIGKYIIRPEADGQLYYVSEDRISYITISISDKELTNDFHKFLRLHQKFIGVSEVDFEKLKKSIIISGGQIDIN